jgi:hypothetical protein
MYTWLLAVQPHLSLICNGSTPEARSQLLCSCGVCQTSDTTSKVRMGDDQQCCQGVARPTNMFRQCVHTFWRFAINQTTYAYCCPCLIWKARS